GVDGVTGALLEPMAEEAMPDMEATPEMEATEEMSMEATPEMEATEEMSMEATEEADMGEEMVMAPITSACLVTDQGGVNDGTFNELAANAINQAAEDFGIEVSIIESGTPTDFEPNINTCLDSDAGAIVTVGFLLADATLAAAEANPDVYFIGVDQFFEGHPSNLVGLQFREDQSGFLAGAFAALMSESGTIGGVYGIEIPPVIKFRNGFEQGAHYVNADITTIGSYTASFIDPAAGQELAQALIGEGADVIFGAGGATGSGGISYAASEGVLVIGVDQDEYFTTFGGGESPGAENILTSAVKRVDVGVYNMLASLIDGSVPWQGGGLYILDATNNGVGLAPTHDATVPQEVLDAVDAIQAMLAEGSLDTGVDGVTGALLESE
ncbi:MAG: BMP family ABC transporter substrate-binding protein, partial [Anaerolineae bacterium]|nr:BMP family ABC transporter substrate-binding protein [Anaerolineae bacterium]